MAIGDPPEDRLFGQFDLFEGLGHNSHPGADLVTDCRADHRALLGMLTRTR
jgi:hypothetical protein